MLIVPDGEHLLVITQEDHALLTGDLAGLWPPDSPLHAAFVAAARIHDNGWREADAAPGVDADGVPHTFSSVPDDIYEDVWRRGIERAAAVDPLVGLLVGLHGARFFAPRTSAGMRALESEERARQDIVLADLGLGGSWDDLPPDVAKVSDRIALLDAVSLVACGSIPRRIDAPVGDASIAVIPDGSTTVLDPWPLAGDGVTVGVPARRIPDRPYRDRADLVAALQDTTPSRVTCTIAPT